MPGLIYLHMELLNNLVALGYFCLHFSCLAFALEGFLLELDELLLELVVVFCELVFFS
jgi:hypothetical protein